VRELFAETPKIIVADLIKKGKENQRIRDFFELLKTDSTLRHKD
jgi:hypothetical protein